MNTNELRQKYLDFFQSKGHRVCASDVLVPTWDPTVLFTPAGMNQFKDHFLGKVKLEFTRAASCQKCLRTGDIDNVGRTPYHHTFFEMLGNFSFGDYFKREAIAWAWEFLTEKKWLGINPDQLTVTVFLDDDEAAEIWQRDIGLDPSRITRKDEYENFWPAGAPTDGPDGVCGPCSEIYFHPPRGKEVEIWNLVFTQFNRVGAPPDNLQPLPSKNIDTGMGLERCVASLQGVTSNYEIDILKPLVLAAADVCSISYEFDSENGRRLRRIADHVRACTFAIHENVYPGPNKEQYVVKRLLRRAVLDGHQMGVTQPFLHRLVPAVITAMEEPYPELRETAVRVGQAIEKEESSFFATIDAGLGRIDQVFNELRRDNRDTVSGDIAAELYQTYGVPAELFESLARDRQLKFDWPGYRTAMERHSEESGKIAVGVMGNTGPIDTLKARVKSTTFLGYETAASDATVVGIVVDNQLVDEIADSATDVVVVVNQSPFYGESGGQVGDTGTIVSESGKFEVRDTQRDSDLILHHGRIVDGVLRNGQSVQMQVDESRRAGIRRAHSATHLLHFALQKHLGTHAQQRGSKVDCDWLRFDFTNQDAVAVDSLQQIESEIGQRIGERADITAKVLPLAEARKAGAMMLFGEKYPDPVRMISIGSFSRELCGGTHLANSSDVQSLELISEEGISANTRRITALTGPRAQEYSQQVTATVAQAAQMLKCGVSALPAQIESLLHQVKGLRKLLAAGTVGKIDREQQKTAGDGKLDYHGTRDVLRNAARLLNVGLFDVAERVESLLQEAEQLQAKIDQLSQQDTVDADQLLSTAIQIGSAKLIVSELVGANANVMRNLIDQIRHKSARTAIFLASIAAADKINLVAGLSRDLVESGIHAGNWVKDIAPVVGGGGGGKPDIAQAGGKHPEKIKQALQAATDYMHAALVT